MFEKYLSSITNKWFFEAPKTLLRYLLININGESLVLIPLFIVIIIFGFFSIDFMLILIGLFIAVRSLGEMIFWMLQQFGARTFRPYDFGLKQLDNQAIYTLHQMINLAGVVLGIGMVIMIVYF